MPITIGRPINGVSINGLEFIVGDNGDKKQFESEAEARAWLKGLGFTDDHLDEFHYVLSEESATAKNAECAFGAVDVSVTEVSDRDEDAVNVKASDAVAALVVAFERFTEFIESVPQDKLVLDSPYFLKIAEFAAKAEGFLSRLNNLKLKVNADGPNVGHGGIDLRVIDLFCDIVSLGPDGLRPPRGVGRNHSHQVLRTGRIAMTRTFTAEIPTEVVAAIRQEGVFAVMATMRRDIMDAMDAAKTQDPRLCDQLAFLDEIGDMTREMHKLAVAGIPHAPSTHESANDLRREGVLDILNAFHAEWNNSLADGLEEHPDIIKAKMDMITRLHEIVREVLPQDDTTARLVGTALGQIRDGEATEWDKRVAEAMEGNADAAAKEKRK